MDDHDYDRTNLEVLINNLPNPPPYKKINRLTYNMYLLPSSQTTPDMYNPLPPTWLETMRYFMTANFP